MNTIIQQCLAVIMVMLTSFTMPAKTENVKIQGDHCRLDAILQTPERKPADVMSVAILMHGLTGNKDGMFLRAIADSLERRGVASIRFDFNGHGHSEGSFTDMTIPNEVTDARMVYNWLMEQHRFGDVYLFGHSQGSVVAALLATELGPQKVKRLVLASTASNIPEMCRKGKLFGYKFDPKNPPASMLFWENKKLGGNYIREAQKIDVYETVKTYTGPVLLLHGGADTGVPPSCSEKLKVSLPQAEMIITPGANHVFTKHTKNLVNPTVDFFTRKMPEKK